MTKGAWNQAVAYSQGMLYGQQLNKTIFIHEADLLLSLVSLVQVDRVLGKGNSLFKAQHCTIGRKVYNWEPHLTKIYNVLKEDKQGYLQGVPRAMERLMVTKEKFLHY